MALMLALGCNGGGGSTSGSTSGSSGLLTGMAAAGDAIIGKIFVLDRNGTIASAVINDDGSYILDVEGMTGPFIVWAQGKANNKFVRVYSYAKDAAHINVTPASNLALALALRKNPAEVDFKGGEVDVVALGDLVEAKKAIVEEKIKVLMASLGFSSAQDFDILKTPFTVAAEGFDKVLDLIDFQAKGDTVVMEDRGSGVKFFEAQVSTGQATVDLKDAALTSAVQEAKSSYQTIGDLADIFQRIVVMYHSGVPTKQALEAAIGESMSPYFLEEGGDKDTVLTSWTTPDENGERHGPPVGMKLLAVSFFKPMGSYAYLDGNGNQRTFKEFDQENSGAYTKGYWTLVTVGVKGQKMTYLTGFVSDGQRWYWYGDHRNVQVNGEIRNSLEIQYGSQASTALESGLSAGMGDETACQAARAAGIKAIYIMGPGIAANLGGAAVYEPNVQQQLIKPAAATLTASLPHSFTFSADGQADVTMTKGLVLAYGPDMYDASQWPGNQANYRIYNAPSKYGFLYRDVDGLDVEAIKAGSVYRGMTISTQGVIVRSWVSYLDAGPIPTAQLTEAMFPSLLAVNGHPTASVQAADLGEKDTIGVLWSTPVDPSSKQGASMVDEGVSVYVGGMNWNENNWHDFNNEPPLRTALGSYWAVERPAVRGTIYGSGVILSTSDSKGRRFEANYRWDSWSSMQQQGNGQQ